MIRFMPDTGWDLLWRPLDMASPESGLYVEFMAPDIRLAAVLGLAVLFLLLWALRRAKPLGRPAACLLGAMALAYLAWMASSGNGRYFLPYLIVAGPLCIALVRTLPTTRAFQVSLILILLLVQGYLLYLRPPWHYMTWLPWRDAPYFQMALPAQQAGVTFVMAELHPYSLIAPQFDARTRWIRLNSQAGPREHALTQRFLAASADLRLMVPAALEGEGSNHLPSARHADVLAAFLRPHGLGWRPGTSCDFLPSRDLARAMTRSATEEEDLLKRGGFWVCPLRFERAAAPSPSPAPPAGDAQVQAVLDAAERLCPRFFPPGNAVTATQGGGFVRHYLESDTRLYLFPPGVVAYRFWTSINPTVIGSADEVLAGKPALDCSLIRTPNWRRGGP